MTVQGPIDLAFVNRVPINGGVAFATVDAELIDGGSVFVDHNAALTLMTSIIPEVPLPSPTFEGVIKRDADVCVGADNSVVPICGELPVEVVCQRTVITREAAS